MRNSKRGRNTGRVYRGVRDAADVDFDPDRVFPLLRTWQQMQPYLKRGTHVFDEAGDIPPDTYDKWKAVYPRVSAKGQEPI